MKRKYYYLIAVVVVVGVIIWLISRDSNTTMENFVIPVKSGDFNIDVVTTGELEAKNSEKIMGPTDARNFRLWNLTIENMVADGTVVDSGQWVASLSKSEITNSLKDIEDTYEQNLTTYTKTMLDTSMTLRNARDELINLKYSVEEAKITLAQSKFEPPATIRQYEINLDKAQRSLDQSIENYDLKYQTALANMQEITATKNKTERRLEQINDIIKQFTIFAPKSGMLVYRKDWDGSKIGIGSQISTWDPIVAELPDLTKMISKTYVNEVDVSKVKKGQNVGVTVEAFPEKIFTGLVESVANIGEQVSGSNAKVFEVIITVNEYDSILRPAMTTVNYINTDKISDVLFIPIECVYNENGVPFVYTTSGNKQEVKLGKSNENEIIVLEGLSENDKIYLLPPEGSEKKTIKTL
ncbi:efflux RND transporter periplasmic adaptor subunit [Odoribacter sp. OttesenSCG-928-L07]|nr:efflux RND transporter periplasmic adaptor subunit [Odoribacter sp. OttesenSCG-928-L07]MDL2239238.1 efflux RND transporter periplasmic adaptor subunit [Bacteroidales bacterium OttesenSCG-928-L14]MDL2240048.1 efflux RND transporter periplasmic adaptor subunit [Bacteroidales bacterium OttesenSCG-928-K22]